MRNEKLGILIVNLKSAQNTPTTDQIKTFTLTEKFLALNVKKSKICFFFKYLCVLKMKYVIVKIIIL